MINLIKKGLVVGSVAFAAAAAHAQAFQFSTLSAGTVDLSTGIDLETILSTYFNGIAPIDLTTFELNGNNDTGYLAGPGNVNQMNFSFVYTSSTGFMNGADGSLSWTYTNGTGAFANLVGGGDVAIDEQLISGTVYATTSGVTGFLSPASAPEPASYALLGLGVFALVRRRRTR
jgi:hypothetical protein